MSDNLRYQEKQYLIDQIPLFAGLSAEGKTAIAASSILVEFKAGDIIYREGDVADAFYYVITGRIRIYTTKHGVAPDLEYLKRGKCFGIISALTGEPHSVSSQVVNDSIILKIPKDEFGRILKDLPDLAIRLGQILSKRLKAKESAAKKRIFESTIVSAFGVSGQIGTTNYVLNLAISLARETRKNVIAIFLNESSNFGHISSLLGTPITAEPARLQSPFFDDDTLRRSIAKNVFGIDIVPVIYKTGETANLIPLLSYLTNDYHYVVLDLGNVLDKTKFESLKQSDVLHIITASDGPSLNLAAGLIHELEEAYSEVRQKIRVLTSEYGGEKNLAFGEQRKLLKRDIFGTLPDISKLTDVSDAMRVPIVVGYPYCEYSRMLRRIARQIGDCLVGLALGSGAALGIAHIGVLKVLEREKITVDMLAGTSIGALIGALWASGKSIAEIEESISRFKRKIATLRLVDLGIPSKGLIKGREVRRFLVSQLGDKTFYDLKFPLKIVACDIERREEVVLQEGSLVDAVMASISVPGIFEPAVIGGRLLVDGGIINPLPYVESPKSRKLAMKKIIVNA